MHSTQKIKERAFKLVSFTCIVQEMHDQTINLFIQISSTRLQAWTTFLEKDDGLFWQKKVAFSLNLRKKKIFDHFLKIS